ncbi:uncharacterized protein ColSpa_04642 [Colletotrichum spaethianum]|uniref:Uncharacterized protein n=1 Tax=Colletotrichum spaethianum TaxID=700344 RepID=A0AA37L9T4_9PEZI|nr:uncharacterized protein ColSpa_04642 [Colletotrichum spaethianum]GKT44461.1 hypothetical protein ColSpa_04642 [Colletotrichum spaethianum]
MAPFVGRVPGSLSGVKGKLAGSRAKKSEKRLKMMKVDEEEGWKGAGAGEWVSAGYGGDGMVWAWLCGTALAVMISGKEGVALEKGVGFPGGKLEEWFPKELLITEARVKRADMSNLVDEIL